MTTVQVAPGVSPRAALVRLATASFLAYTSYALCRTPLLPLFARALGAGPSLIGLVMGASTLTGVFVKLPAGALSDLLGRRRLLLTGAVIFAALPFTYLAVSTLPVLVLLRVAHGSATAIFGPSLPPAFPTLHQQGSVAHGSARTRRRKAPDRRWVRCLPVT